MVRREIGRVKFAERLASAPLLRYRLSMSLWEGLGENVSRSTRTWVAWAKKHARDIGDAGMRHIERQDLLAEKQKAINSLGARVAERFEDAGAKSVTRSTPGVAELLAHIDSIDERLAELLAQDNIERSNDDESKRGS